MNALDGLPSSRPLQCRIQERDQVPAVGLNVIATNQIWNFLFFSQASSFSLSSKTPERMKRSALFRQFDDFDVW